MHRNRSEREGARHVEDSRSRSRSVAPRRSGRDAEGPPPAAWPAVDRAEEGLYDVPVGGVRHIRLWSGLVLIAAAILVIVVEQLLGIGSQDSRTPHSPPATTLPSLATTYVRPDLAVKARYVERQSVVGGTTAGTGKEFVVIAVLVTNRQQRPLAVAQTDFHVYQGGKPVCTAEPYPGRQRGLRSSGLGQGHSAQGVVICSVPRGSPNLVFQYTSESGSHAVARWSID